METSTLTSSEATRPIWVRLPFVSTSFADDIWYYALLWPLWWVLGIEQILLPFFLIYELMRFLIRSDWRVRFNTTGFIALLLAVWWLVPIVWVDREFLDIYLKEAATIWSQAIFLILIFNCVRTGREWWVLAKAVTILAIYTAASGIIFLSGIWQGSISSVLGSLLPPSLVESSVFFSSISLRDFGWIAGADELLPYRLRGFSLTYSSLSMICLLLIPFIYWRMKIAKGIYRVLFAMVAFGLFLCLLFTGSRISYLALVVAIVLYWALRIDLLRKRNLPLTVALILAAIGGGILLGYIAQRIIFGTFESTFIDLRPGSWIVRFKVYMVTLQLIPEHLIAGWGVPVRISGVSNAYSAGTHSSYLGMLFQHGIVGLFFYLALWLSLWNQVIQGLKNRNTPWEIYLFWIATATTFLAFNVREIVDSWWWDQSLTYTIWGLWGMVITVTRCADLNNPDRGTKLIHSQVDS